MENEKWTRANMKDSVNRRQQIRLYMYHDRAIKMALTFLKYACV